MDRALPSEDASVEAGWAAEAPTTEKMAKVVAEHSVRAARTVGGITAAGREGETKLPWEADAARCS